MPKTHPILMNTEMVRAFIDGRKTQTRRCVPAKYVEHATKNSNYPDFFCVEFDNGDWFHGKDLAPYQPGDILYVRETWRLYDRDEECACYDHCSCPQTGTPIFRADNDDSEVKWSPSIHMPKWACRLFLKVKTVRVERLQQIRVEDCIAEGVDTAETLCPVRKDQLHSDAWYDGEKCEACGAASVHDKFCTLWDSLAKPGTRWADNPWVWVYEFEPCDKPEGWSNI